MSNHTSPFQFLGDELKHFCVKILSYLMILTNNWMKHPMLPFARKEFLSL